MATCGVLPGPNIAEKTAKAKELVQVWYDELKSDVHVPESATPVLDLGIAVHATAAQAAAQMQGDAHGAHEGDVHVGDTLDTAPVNAPANTIAVAPNHPVPASVVETMLLLDRELTRVAAPGWAGLFRAHGLLTLFHAIDKQTRESEGGAGGAGAGGEPAAPVIAGQATLWTALDNNSGMPLASWLASAAPLRRPAACTLAGLIAAIAEPEDVVLSLRALMLHAVRMHSNRVARAADAPMAAAAVAAVASGEETALPMLAQFPGTRESSANVLLAFHEWVIPMFTNVQETLIQ